MSEGMEALLDPEQGGQLRGVAMNELGEDRLHSEHGQWLRAVSYTHLTLPTIYSV